MAFVVAFPLMLILVALVLLATVIFSIDVVGLLLLALTISGILSARLALADSGAPADYRRHPPGGADTGRSLAG